MSCLRVEKDKEHPYVILNKDFLNDKNISLTLKGFLAYCLCKPDHWEFHVSAMCKELQESRATIYRIIQEGVQNGYIFRELQRFEGRFQKTDYTISEKKIKEKSTVSQNPDTVLETLSNNEDLRSYEVCNERLSYDSKKPKSEKIVDRSYPKYPEKEKTSIPYELTNLRLTEKDQRIFAKKLREGTYRMHHMHLAIEDAKTFHKPIYNLGAFLTQRMEEYTNLSKLIP